MRKTLTLLICLFMAAGFLPVRSVQAAADGVNVALGKPVSVSSWYADDHSDAHADYKINDGDVNSSWASGSRSTNGYYQATIDLGAEYDIGKIIGRTRRDMDQPDTRIGWDLIGSNTADFSDSKILATKVTAGAHQEDWEVNFEEPVTYRYVRVRSGKAIVVSELEVYGLQLVKGTLQYGDVEERKYDNPIRVNEYFGFIVPTSKTEFGVTALITRGEAARIMAKLAKSNGEYIYNDIYSDVSTEHEYASDIQFCYEYGIISPAESLRPDDYITCAEFIKMIECVLGYKQRISGIGQYPENVMQLGSQLALYTNLKLVSDEKITKGEAVIALYNTLLSVKAKLGDDIYDKVKEDGDQPYIETGFGMKLIEGIVNANSATSLKEAEGRTSKTTAKINGVEYEDKERQLFDFLGENIFALIRDDDMAVLSAWRNSKETAVVRLQARDIYTSSLSRIETDDRKKYEIESDCVVIYNGVVFFDFTADTFKPENGYTEFIDNDGDGDIEVLKVWKPEVYVTKAYTFEEDNIYITNLYGESLKCTDIDELDIRVSGVYTPAEDIKPAGKTILIKVYSSENGAYVRADYGCGVASIGVPSAVSTDNVMIDGEVHFFSDFYSKNQAEMEPLRIGYEVEYLSDEFSNIIAVMSAKSSNKDAILAYIIKPLFGEESARIKLYNENMEFLSLPFAKKASIDGKSYEINEIAEWFERDAAYFEKSMTYYKVNDNNEIYFLETEKNTKDCKLKIIEGVIDDTCYRYSTAMYRGLYMKMPIPSTGKAFVVPIVDGAVPSGSSYDDYYNVTTMPNAIPQTTRIIDADWNVRFYNGDDYNTPEFCVVEKECISTSDSLGIKIGLPVASEKAAYMVESATYGINANDEPCVTINAYADHTGASEKIEINARIEYMYEKYKIYKDKKSQWCDSYGKINLDKITDLTELINYVAPVIDIKGGDILHLNIDGGKATSVERLYSAENQKNDVGLVYNGGPDPNQANASLRMIKGTFVEYTNGRIILDTGMGSLEFFDPVTLKTIIMVDKRGNSRKVKLSELTPYSAKQIKMLAYTKWANLYDIVAYEE